ncbi:HNH endonuclease family protein [Candidatus Mycalebacterium sp.]
MKIELTEITIRELSEGYQDNAEDGVVGYGGKLDIRPPYQREFIYKDKQRDAVIDTITKDFPLNVMYWAVRKDGDFEIIDGQQRTISICQYVKGVFSYEGLYFDNLQDDKQQQIRDYKLMVYLCSGTDSEKLEWFKTINIAGEELTNQELRNAVYSGSWVSDAKRYFSKNGCAAYGLGSDYLKGVAIRQEYLETAIKWISKDDIEEYMGTHQHDKDAVELWKYFQSVINWVKAVFPNYRKEMKGVEWGFLHNEFQSQKFDSVKFENEILTLMQDEDVTNKKGIYEYVLTRKEKHLNIRTFNDNQKREAYERQKGICAKCGEHFELNEMEADHITPWHEGGKTTPENCQMLCKEDNRTKSGK